MDTYDPGITKIKSIGAIQLCETRNLFVNLCRWAPYVAYVVSEVIVKKIEAINIRHETVQNKSEPWRMASPPSGKEGVIYYTHST